jgi:hypothetical protein
MTRSVLRGTLDLDVEAGHVVVLSAAAVRPAPVTTVP